MIGLPFGDAPDGYTYAVSEEPVVDYQSPKYFDGDTQVMGAVQIGDGGTIRNDQIGAVLPSTGGPGTSAFYLLGTLLVGLASVSLLILRRRQSARRE